MFIAYYDESGDDGYPKYASPVFVMSALYLDRTNWNKTLEALKDFRGRLDTQFGIPRTLEIHMRELLRNKHPFSNLGLALSERVQVVTDYCDLIANMDVRVINVAAVKPRINSASYDVLDRSLTYSVQRIYNDLPDDEHFLVVTDEGRVGMMRRTTRRIRKHNPVPSKIMPGSTLSMAIRQLIEDPLPKDSRESYFIQTADVIAYVVYLYVGIRTGAAKIPNRLKGAVTKKQVKEWMDRLRPSLNTAAARGDPYGVKIHPNP